MTACTAVACPQGHGPHEAHPAVLTPPSVEAQLADLQRQVRSAYLDAVRARDAAARDVTAAGRVRAVAHQTHASRLLRILDTQREPS